MKYLAKFRYLFLFVFVLILSSCAAYFQTDGPSSYRGRVGTSFPQDSLIFKK